MKYKTDSASVSLCCSNAGRSRINTPQLLFHTQFLVPAKRALPQIELRCGEAAFREKQNYEQGLPFGKFNQSSTTTTTKSPATKKIAPKEYWQMFV